MEKLPQGTYEIKTPIMLNRDLWVTSGHFTEKICISPTNWSMLLNLNCPVCFITSQQYSFNKQLPLRIAELGLVHRHELKGALGGLFRVRAFHQDDAHIFMKETDITKKYWVFCVCPKK